MGTLNYNKWLIRSGRLSNNNHNNEYNINWVHVCSWLGVSIMHSHWQLNWLFESHGGLLIHGYFGMDIRINNTSLKYSALYFQTPVNILSN